MNAQRIIEILRHVSKEDYCAGWLTNLEHIYWNSCIDPDDTPHEGEDPFRFHWTSRQWEVDQLRRLAAECKGWVRYSEDGPVFVPMDEWLKIHAEYTGKEMTDDQRRRFADFMDTERAARELQSKRERLTECAAVVALAIQASGRLNAHLALVEILRMVPREYRACTKCGALPDTDHLPNCTSRSVYD